jgi:hypothetical protein
MEKKPTSSSNGQETIEESAPTDDTLATPNDVEDELMPLVPIPPEDLESVPEEVKKEEDISEPVASKHEKKKRKKSKKVQKDKGELVFSYSLSYFCNKLLSIL